jgi:hypothetical protein
MNFVAGLPGDWSLLHEIHKVAGRRHLTKQVLKQDEGYSKAVTNKLNIFVKTFTRTSIATFFIAVLALVISSCTFLAGALTGNIGSTAAADQGNALKVDYQRSPDESLNEFENFVEERNMEIISKENNTLTASGSFGGATRSKGQDIRMKAVAKESDSNTSLTVVIEYLDPTSGEYKRANNNTGTVTSKEEVQTTEVRTFMGVKNSFISRYGGDNVEAIDSGLTY